MAKRRAAPQERAFLDDILADAGDLTARRIFADWLDDHGQPHRGEFIRVQCDLDGLDEDDPRRPALREREWELLTVCRDEWLQGLPAWLRQASPAFRRGFVERVSLTAREFLKQGPRLFALAPIRDLHLRAVGGKLAEVAASPLLGRLAALDLGESTPGENDLRSLPASPHLAGLTALSLRQVGHGVVLGEILAGWHDAPRLERLDLSSNRLPQEAFLALARAPFLESLRWLDLSGSPPDAGLNVLLETRRLAGLRHLRLRTANVSSQMPALVEPDHLPGLTALDLGGHWLAYDALILLGRSDLIGRLESLQLDATFLTAADLRALLGPGRTTRLRRLGLAHNSYLRPPAAMEALATAALDALHSLDLTGSGVEPEGLRLLVGSPRLAGLRSLSLSGGRLGDDGVRVLAGSPHLTGLTHLHLTRVGIGPVGAAALAAWPGLANVRVLALDGNPLGPEGVAALAASPHLTNLYHLSLGTTDLGDAGVRALAAANLPNLRHLNLWGCHSPDEAALRELASSPRLPRLLVLKVQVVMHDTTEELRRLGREVAV